ncbi:MAG: beta-N-acetylhexosaminidase [Candidatus Sigynarchaeota archaeon]
MKITIFPDPVELKERDGVYAVPAGLASYLGSIPADFSTCSSDLARFSIFLSIADENAPIDRIGFEGYVLTVKPDRIEINANTTTGCFYGIQTIRWLMPKGDSKENETKHVRSAIPCCEIVDYPRFPYRGYMLDEGRYFLGVDVVKSVLDWMALLKLNRFHWHLTEDQGWRIEIKKYPRLTEIGSRRDGTPIYRNGRPPEGMKNSDGIPHGGFYTQAQIKEIIEYAADRHIVVVPEIEMPGHATAMLASYPEMRCVLPDDFPPQGADIFGHHLDGADIKVASSWGVFANIICAGNPKAIEFLHDILKEVAGLFPGPIVHIGGDEVPKAQWMCCERCQERMAALGLKTEEELQKTFTAEIIDYLASLGKITMLWNEHTDETLAERKEHVICQYWTGTLEKVNGFLERGGRLLMSPSSSVYMDMAYSTLPLKKVYHYDPLGPETLKAISKAAAKKAAEGGIIGVEAPMWGEVFQNKAQVEYCTFPRAFAIADTCWTPKDKKNHALFMERVAIALEYWDLLGIKHATLAEADPSNEAIELAKKNPKFGPHMYF